MRKLFIALAVVDAAMFARIRPKSMIGQLTDGPTPHERFE